MMDSDTLTNKSISRLIIELEKSFSPNEFSLFGINFWPIIRLHLFFKLVSRNYKNSANPKKIDFEKCNKSSRYSTRGQSDLFVTHSNYFIKVNNEIHDRVLGKLISNSSNPIVLDLSDYSLYSGKIGQKIGSIRHAIVFLKIVSFLAAIFFQVNHSFKSNIRLLRETAKIENDIHSIFGMDLRKKIFFVYFLSLYSSRLLKKYKVKNIYQSMYYDNFGLASTLAADNLRITSHCVQHGGQSENNPIFGNWSNTPSYGYQFLPNIFLCWDDLSAKSINNWAKKTEKHTTQIIGYGWIDIWKDNKKSDSENTSKGQNHTGLLQIIVTLQPSVDLMKSFLYEFIKSNHADISWLLRVHPRQNNEKYISTLTKEFSEVPFLKVESSDTPLPEMLEMSNVHITFFSSSIYEAKYLNVPTIIVDKRGLDYFESLIDDGFATYAEDKETLSRTINNFLK